VAQQELAEPVASAQLIALGREPCSQVAQCLVRCVPGPTPPSHLQHDSCARAGIAPIRLNSIPSHPQILSELVGDTQKYSWCNPPSTDLARTARSSHQRWRDFEPGLICISGGGSGTPGPNAMCGRPLL
jgi:hypothetical protein